MIAVRTHAASSQTGAPTVRPMSAETMKMPDPIIEPATSIVASVRVSARTKPVASLLCDAVASGGAATLCIPPLWRVGSTTCAGLRRGPPGRAVPSCAGGRGGRARRSARAQQTYRPTRSAARSAGHLVARHDDTTPRRRSGAEAALVVLDVRDRVLDRGAVRAGGRPKAEGLEVVERLPVEGAVPALGHGEQPRVAMLVDLERGDEVERALRWRISQAHRQTLGAVGLDLGDGRRPRCPGSGPCPRPGPVPGAHASTRAWPRAGATARGRGHRRSEERRVGKE